MRYSVSSYSFSALMQSEGMTQLNCIAAAKALGFDGIEFTDLTPPSLCTQEDYARVLKGEAAACGLTITNYAVGADLLNGSEGNADAEIARLKRQVDIAALLGAPCLRHDATYNPPVGSSFDTVLPLLAERVRAVTEYAQQKGVFTMTENHGFFCQDSDRMEKLVMAVNHPNYGLLTDIGNFLCADENPVIACARVAPYAHYIHAKDFLVKSGMEADPGQYFFRSRAGKYLRGTILGHGDVPVRQCFYALKRAGFGNRPEDTIALEFEGPERTRDALCAGLENLHRFWEEA